MIVAMQEAASEEQIQVVIEHLMEMGFSVHRTTGERQSILAAVGARADFDTRNLEVLSGVEHVHRIREQESCVPRELLVRATEVTDANAALFDVANGFAGCIAGLHEILRRQGLLQGRWCLDPHEDLSPGQEAEINRVCAAYPQLRDDTFVAEHLDTWLR